MPPGVGARHGQEVCAGEISPVWTPAGFYPEPLRLLSWPRVGFGEGRSPFLKRDKKPYPGRFRGRGFFAQHHGQTLCRRRLARRRLENHLAADDGHQHARLGNILGGALDEIA